MSHPRADDTILITAEICIHTPEIMYIFLMDLCTQKKNNKRVTKFIWFHVDEALARHDPFYSLSLSQAVCLPQHSPHQ